MTLPETDLIGDERRGVTEQPLEALRPVKLSAFYIPIPNRIIRSPGSKRRIFRALKRAAFKRERIVSCACEVCAVS